jgi:ubiquinone biosynthesis protein
MATTRSSTPPWRNHLPAERRLAAPRSNPERHASCLNEAEEGGGEMARLLGRPWFTDRAVVDRSRQIAQVFSRLGLGAVVDRAGLGRFAPLVRPAERRPPPPAARLRLALGELGVVFIKLGQMLSTRADLLPAEFVTELAMLQDSAPPVPIDDVRRTITEDLGAPPEQVFGSFEEEPIASASIGQVHGAVLPEGTPVVVKVRRPGVIEEVERDLDILSRLAQWSQTHTAFGRDIDLMPIVAEFAYGLRNELDYVREGHNAERLGQAFAGDTSVWIPRVHWDYTTARVLTLDRVGGVKVTEIATLDRLKVPRRAIARNAVRMFMREVLDLGFFHADPHPGNFFVQPDGSIAVVDFGMVGRVTESVRHHLLRAGLAATEQDPESLAEELFALGVAGRRADREAFVRDLDHLLARYQGRSIRELSAAAVTRELSAIAFRHRLQLPGELALLMRVMAMSEGLGLTVDPGFRYFEVAAPIIRRRWRREHSPRAGARRLGRAALDAAELGVELPRRAGRLLGRLERGELELNMRHEGLERLAQEFQRMTNRLAMAVVLAASVVALGVGLGANGGMDATPFLKWLFGLGFFFSLTFGIWLLGSVWRAGRR